jgi:hypothetical protein
MKRILSVVLASFVLCSGFVCTGSQIHNLRLANADLASALNHAAQEVISLDSQGAITPQEENSALLKINEATVLSDGITKCLDNVTIAASPATCVQPFLQGVQNDMNSLGIKSPGAQAALSGAISAVIVIFDEFAKQGVTK